MLYNRSQHNVAGQLYFKNRQAKKQTNKFVAKEIRPWLPEVGGVEGEMDVGSQKVQNSSYKINIF